MEDGWLARARPSPYAAFLELLALTGLTIAQPLLDSFGRSDIFVTQQAPDETLFLFAAVLVFVPPVILWLVEGLAGLASTRARTFLHLGLLGLLAALLAVQLLKQLTSAAVTVILAVSVGAGLVAVYLHFRATREWLRWLALAPPVFAVLFLFASPLAVEYRQQGSTIATVDAVEPAAPDSPPVVMVIFDELPTTTLLGSRGSIDRTLFPNFAELADDASWYRNATSPSEWTRLAIPMILTGNYPADNSKRMPTFARYPDNLFTLLGGTHDLNVFESFTHLCPHDLCTGGRPSPTNTAATILSESTDVWVERVDPWSDGGATPDVEIDKSLREDPPKTFHSFVESLEPAPAEGGRPRFDFAHIVLPHQPWWYGPSGARYDAARNPPGGGGDRPWADEYKAADGFRRHLLQTQFADELLGEMLDELHRLDTYDDSIVIVMADHGAGFTPGANIRGISESNRVNTMWAPLFIKLPGQTESVVSDLEVEHVDVLPTVADYLSVDLPWDVDGESFADGSVRSATKRVYPQGWDKLEPGPDGYVEYAGDLPPEIATSQARHDGDGAELDLFRWGPYRRLVGASVETLAIGADTTFGGAAAGGLQPSVDDLDESVPLFVEGTIETADDLQLAIAVNGVVASVVPTYRDGDHATWFSTTPPSLWWAGANTIELYQVEGDPSSPVLHPLR